MPENVLEIKVSGKIDEGVDITRPSIGGIGTRAPQIPGIQDPTEYHRKGFYAPGELMAGFKTQEEQTEWLKQEKKMLDSLMNLEKSSKKQEDLQKFIGPKQIEQQSGILATLGKIAGPLILGFLVSQSKIVQTTLSSLMNILSAVADTILAPFIPLIVPLLQSLAPLLIQIAQTVAALLGPLIDFLSPIFNKIKEGLDAITTILKILFPAKTPITPTAPGVTPTIPESARAGAAEFYRQQELERGGRSFLEQGTFIGQFMENLKQKILPTSLGEWWKLIGPVPGFSAAQALAETTINYNITVNSAGIDSNSGWQIGRDIGDTIGQRGIGGAIR